MVNECISMHSRSLLTYILSQKVIYKYNHLRSVTSGELKDIMTSFQLRSVQNNCEIRKSAAPNALEGK